MRQRVYYYEDENIKNKQITARYKFSLQFVKNKLVVDIGCGARRGPYILSGIASKVVATDISQETIIYSAKEWPRNNLSYITTDAKFLPFKNDSFDCVISLEVIEHINDYESFLSEVKRVMQAEGVFVVSTPNRPVISPGAILSNPDHIREFDLEEFRNILNGHFSNFTLYGQKPSHKVTEAENFLNYIYQNLNRIPDLFRQLLPKVLKRKILKTFISFFAKIKALPDPNQIIEEDFIFEDESIEKARYFLAVCRK